MYFLLILILIIIGAVAAAGFVENKIPQTKTTLNVIKPQSEWIGLVSLILGLFWLIKQLFHLNGNFVHILIILASYCLLILLGYLLAQPLIMQLIGKNKNISEAADKVKNKITPVQEKLGLASIALGLINLLLYITRL